jgi:hypothetical protein
MKKNNTQKIIPRFRWIVIAYVLVLVCILFVRYYNPNLTDRWNFVVWGASFGLTVWLFFDYTVLQTGKYFFVSLILSLIHLFFFRMVFQDLCVGVFKNISMQPLLFLIFQFLTRRIFIAIMEREPSTDRSANTWQDKIYSIIILGGSFLPLIF